MGAPRETGQAVVSGALETINSVNSGSYLVAGARSNKSRVRFVRGVFVENHDSFSWNVIDLLPVDRSALRVVTAQAALNALEGADFLVIGPGPMDPVRAGLLRLVEAAAARQLPTLGICLGHQALGLGFGATLVRSTPAHGVLAQASFRRSRLLPGLEGDHTVMRYHSLSLRDVRAPLEVIASLADGTVMAVEHQTLPMVGLQFHPDSYATERGAEMLSAFFTQAVRSAPRRVGPPRPPAPRALPVPEVTTVKLSSLCHARDFALFAPGYDDSPEWSLFTDVRPGGDDFFLCEAETRTPRWFSGQRHAVRLELDVAPATYAPQVDAPAFSAGIEHIRAAIAAGDVYQVNLTQRVSLGATTGAEVLSTLCRRGVPRFAAWFNVGGVGEFVTASPELLFERTAEVLRVEPMKGTAGRDQRPALEASTKDAAELAMITDLLRDDLHRLCTPGSVQVKAPRRFIELPYAVQTVSDVEGRLDPQVTTDEVVCALHPGGSVTGAPREAALSLIARLEATPRRFYCGALGLETRARAVRCALLIRTAFRDEVSGEFWYGVGGGITWNSSPAAELAELEVKLGALRVKP